MIIATDFDGTCVSHAYPNIGVEIGASQVLKALTENGHKIILHTMRCDKTRVNTSMTGMKPEYRDCLSEAVNWFKVHDIPLYGINENPGQKNWTTSPKIFANLYIDDAALGAPMYLKHIDWREVLQILYSKQLITKIQADKIRANLDWKRETSTIVK